MTKKENKHINQILIKKCTNKKCQMFDIPYLTQKFDYSGDEIRTEKDEIPGACRECGFELKDEYSPLDKLNFNFNSLETKKNNKL